MSNIWRVRTAITGGTGSAQLSTMYFDQAAGLTAQHAADAVRAFWVAASARVVLGYTFAVEQVVTDIDTATGRPTGVESVVVASLTGQVNGQACPWATQGLVEWRSGTYVGGREIRGRTFIPGVPEDENNSGTPQASYVTALSAAATALATDANSSLCIYSPTKRAIGVVTSGNCWTNWAVLRSRRD